MWGWQTSHISLGHTCMISKFYLESRCPYAHWWVGHPQLLSLFLQCKSMNGQIQICVSDVTNSSICSRLFHIHCKCYVFIHSHECLVARIKYLGTSLSWEMKAQMKTTRSLWRFEKNNPPKRFFPIHIVPFTTRSFT